MTHAVSSEVHVRILLSADQLSIARLVPHGSCVLDLGCGTGALLAYLIKERGCTGYA